MLQGRPPAPASLTGATVGRDRIPAAGGCARQTSPSRDTRRTQGPPMDAPIPTPRNDDDEDVHWALSTAGALWARGERVEALKWLRRAAEQASDVNADTRALELFKAAADLASKVSAVGAAAEGSALRVRAAAGGAQGPGPPASPPRPPPPPPAPKAHRPAARVSAVPPARRRTRGRPGGAEPPSPRPFPPHPPRAAR